MFDKDVFAVLVADDSIRMSVEVLKFYCLVVVGNLQRDPELIWQLFIKVVFFQIRRLLASTMSLRWMDPANRVEVPLNLVLSQMLLQKINASASILQSLCVLVLIWQSCTNVEVRTCFVCSCCLHSFFKLQHKEKVLLCHFVKVKLLIQAAQVVERDASQVVPRGET